MLAHVASLLHANEKSACIFLAGHQLPVLLYYSFVSPPAEVITTSENALLTVVTLGYSIDSLGSLILKLCNYISQLSN